MLPVRENIVKIRGESRPLSELIPWMTLVTNDLVLNKDGTLVAVFKFDGVDIEGLDDVYVENLAQTFERALRVLSDRITLSIRMSRVRAPTLKPGHFPDPVSQAIEDSWCETLSRGHFYTNEHHLAVMFSPPKGAEKFIDAAYHHIDESGSVIKGLVNALRESYSETAAFRAIVDKMGENISQFNEILDRFADGLDDLHLRRLAGGDLLAHLHSMTSPASCASHDYARQPVSFDTDNRYLDTTLGSDVIEPHSKHLQFHGTETRFMAVLSIKSWPSESWAGLLDGLLAAPFELTVSQTYRLLNIEEAKAHIKDVRRMHFNMRKGILTMLREILTNKEEERGDEAREGAIDETTDALHMLATQRVAGFYNLTIMVYGRDEKELANSVSGVAKILQGHGFIVLRENLHALSAWASTLYGQWAEALRWVFFVGRSTADIALIHAVSSGSPDNKHLSVQTNKPQAALTTFRTEWATPYHFNLHYQDLGNTLIVGPSGAGKSVFANFLISQWRRYMPCRIVIFDKDYSCRIPTLLQGGSHLDVGNKRVQMNPLAKLDTPKDHEWAHGFLEMLIGSRGYEISARDTKAIWEAVDGLAALEPSHRQLGALATLLPANLAEQLAEWTGEGAQGALFDNKADALSLSDYTCIEMGGLLTQPHTARAFMEYAFHRVDELLDGTPTLIYVEEAWFMLEDPQFASKINDWLRTLRKRNGLLMMATQSLDELASSKVFSAILSSVLTRIFLPNMNALAAKQLYQGAFLLNDAQVERIATAQPKRQYYCVNPSMSRLVDAPFPPDILARLRSDARAQRLFDKWEEQKDHTPDWRERYVQEVSQL